SVNNYKPIWNGLLTIIGDDIGKTYNGSEGSDTIYAGAGNDTILGGNSDDILHGGDGNDIINGGMGNDTLYGGNGDDTLHGGYGNDTFIGGKGDDLLVGGRGNKTYIFAKGDGNDTINNFDTQNTVSDDIDVIKFTDVKSDEVSYRGENYDLIIDYGNGDSIRIQGFFISGWEKIDEIHFADGMVITLTDLQSKPIVVNVSVNNYEPIWNGLLTIIGDDIGKTYNGSEGSNTIYAGAGNDTISGGDGDDTLHGGDGNDIIDGGMGNDTLYGGNGDDTLYGGYGNDTFIGGKGDDLLVGGRGNKTYIFAKGDGNDTINNFDTQNTVSDDIDVIKFTDVKSDEVSYRGENYDLIIEYGNDDSIRIQGFFISGWEKIDEIHFADGNVVKQNEIQGLMDAQKDQSLARTMNMANEASPITVNQELHSLISAMASFDSANSTNDDFIVTSDQSLSKAMLTTSIY
ncbi:calcium-binding protein, partial [Wohlfahrtiimonas populi]|uniref:calcium-binding protein n=1 Tax=Wohlfahrtiimonas populi TaxID=1940240 RepID=UPI0022B934EF